MPLTDLAIRNLKPPHRGQITYPDDSLPGFGVRVSPGGAKTFVLVHGRSRRRTTIGRVGVIKLKDAREEARRILAGRMLGNREGPAISFARAFATFSEVRLAGNRQSTRYTTESRLKRHFYRAFQHEKLADIFTSDIAEILDRLRHTPSEAFHGYAAIRLFFRWAVGRKYLAQSPVVGLDAPPASMPRSRVLTDDEVRAVLRYAHANPCDFSSIVQLLLLTGQRRGEIGGLHSAFVDKQHKLISFPPTLTKNRREHIFPYGDLAAPLLVGNGLLFPAKGHDDRPFSGWSKAKTAFDRNCGVTDWTLHDLRRTFATNLAALGVPVHVTEKLLNHISGTTGGIVAIYQRHAYLSEMRAAIEAWEAKLSQLIAAAPPPDDSH